MLYKFKDHKKGDTFKGVTFTIKINQVPINLNNATIKMALKLSKNTNTVIKLFSTTENTISIVNASNGMFKINSQVVDIPAATYFYDIQITLANGEVKTYIDGTWKIIQDVTQ